MQDNNDKREGKATVGYTGPGEGAQGVDKAPGEETATGNDDLIRRSQKGKDKEDGDPTKESDQPLDKL